MIFELTGFGNAPFISAPAGWFGFALMVFYALVTLAALALNFDFGRLRARQWLGLATLACLGFLFAQLFILYFPANILPPPGLPAETQRPGLALFALAPAFLAGGWLGVGPAVVVGWLTGLSRAVWETRSLATPFEFALLAGVVAWGARQDYRGWPAAGLRHPLVAGLLAWRMRADAGLGALVSSKVNQWTLLIGCLPIAYAISSGSINPLPTDTRQTEEVLLTAAQSLLAVVLLINLRMSVLEAAVLAVLFMAQFLTPHSLVSRDLFSIMYISLAGVFAIRQLIEMRPFVGQGRLARRAAGGTGLARPPS